MACCEACIHGGPCVSYSTRDEQAAAHAELILADARTDGVRALARDIVSDLGPDPEGYSTAEAAAVHRWLRGNIRYVREHDEVWTRTADLIRMGAGDCDDLATAAAAMLASLGHTVGLAYGSGHVWVVVETPDGDVRHVDATSDAPPWSGPPVDIEELFIIEGTGPASSSLGSLATGAAGDNDPCGWSGPIETVPRGELAACIKGTVQAGGWTDKAQAAAQEVVRRCQDGHGSMTFPGQWCTHFHMKYGCDTVKAVAQHVDALGLDLGAIVDVLCFGQTGPVYGDPEREWHTLAAGPESDASEWLALAQAQGATQPGFALLAPPCEAGVPGACSAFLTFLAANPDYYAVVSPELLAHAQATSEAELGPEGELPPAIDEPSSTSSAPTETQRAARTAATVGGLGLLGWLLFLR